MKLLLLGETCEDKYIYGNCSRLSPEAPVPVVSISNTDTKPGMAANVYQNLHNISDGKFFIDFFTNSENIVKTRYIDERSRQQLLRVDSEPKLCQVALPENLDSYDAIVISDYDKGFISISTLVYLRNKYKGPIYLDTKKRELAALQGFIIKINESEHNALISYPKSSEVIITMGSLGAVYNKNVYPAQEIKDIVDVCGCGDTFLAALAVAHLATNEMDYAIHFANKVAGITVQHRGTYAPHIYEIMAC